ncbi:hypothetical protein [Fulvimarina sp. MAC3]|uniref:hypothetical protein n=1 Tax=Fulvimarina sp. MAC3 TaxID=3148887 RepID=UPI0031FDABC4
MRRITAGLSAAAFATMLGCGTALAADANAFAERLKEAMASMGGNLTYDEAVSENDTVIMRGVKLGRGAGRVDVGQVNFENVVGEANTGYEVDRVGFEDIAGTDEAEGDRKISYDISGMSIEDLLIAGTEPSNSQPTPLQGIPFFFKLGTIANIKLSEDGEDTFTMTNLTANSDVGQDGSFDSKLSLANFQMVVPEGDDREGANVARELGYDVLTGSMTAETAWKPENGDLSFSPIVLNVQNVGTLQTDLAISGYTPQVIQSLQDVTEKMQQNPESQQNGGMALMGILAQLSVAKVSLAFQDDSLTQRLIDYYAKETNQSPEAIIDLATQTVQANLGQIGDDAFRNQVVSAVKTFLEKPETIRVSTEPAQPIPVMQLVGAAMGAPQTIPNVLQLQVQTDGGKSIESSQ